MEKDAQKLESLDYQSVEKVLLHFFHNNNIAIVCNIKALLAVSFFIESLKKKITGAPVVASWPHFYDGDKEYLDQSIGLKPDKESHETFISLEPVKTHFVFFYTILQEN